MSVPPEEGYTFYCRTCDSFVKSEGHLWMGKSQQLGASSMQGLAQGLSSPSVATSQEETTRLYRVQGAALNMLMAWDSFDYVDGTWIEHVNQAVQQLREALGK